MPCSVPPSVLTFMNDPAREDPRTSEAQRRASRRYRETHRDEIQEKQRAAYLRRTEDPEYRKRLGQAALARYHARRLARDGTPPPRGRPRKCPAETKTG